MTAKKISALTAATEAQIYNDIILPIVSGGITLKAAARSALFWALVPDGAAVHNCIYRGKDITADHTSGAMSTNIANGTFRNIFIGDYITMKDPLDTTKNMRWRVAHLDYYLHAGSTETTAHHVVLVAEDASATTAKMNDSNTTGVTSWTKGAYLGSKMWNETIPTINTNLESTFGAAHVLSHQTLLSNAMTAATASKAGAGLAGASTGWEWIATKANLLNEEQVYGTSVCASSYFDTGVDNRQLALFAMDPDKFVAGKGLNGARQTYWLRTVASSTYFAFVTSVGFAYYYGASNSIGVRPLFCYI